MSCQCGHFEKLAPPLAKQDGAYFASDRLTWVDFIIFDLLETHSEFAAYDFGTKHLVSSDILTTTFPRLANFYKQIAARPAFVRHRQSKNRFPYTVPNMPKPAGKQQK